MNGYVKLDRALQDWRYKTKPNYVALWVHLLLVANHQDRKVYDTEVKRGQLLTSLEKLAQGTGLSIQNIRTILAHLNGEELTIKSTNKNTLITIVKYSEYQGTNTQTNKQTNNEPTSNQHSTNNKQEYKERKKERIYIYNSPEFLEALDGFREMRKRTKHPLTPRAEELMLKKLEQISTDEQNAIDILDQSVYYAWQGIFQLNNNFKQEDKLPEYDTAKNVDVSKSEEEELLKLMGKA